MLVLNSLIKKITNFSSNLIIVLVISILFKNINRKNLKFPRITKIIIIQT